MKISTQRHLKFQSTRGKENSTNFQEEKVYHKGSGIIMAQCKQEERNVQNSKGKLLVINNYSQTLKP